MKLLLLGATGRTGKQVLELALAKGYSVTCLVRDPSKIEAAKNLTILKGNANSMDDLESALQKNDCVISVLNVARTSDFPWAPLRTPKTFMSDVLSKLVSLNDTRPIERMVICSAWGVRDTRKDIPFWFRGLIDMSNIGAAYKDHACQEKIIENSDLNWTVVRPVGLTNSEKEQTVLESIHNDPKPKLTISRKAVATYLLRCLHRDDLIGKKIVISGRRK